MYYQNKVEEITNVEDHDYFIQNNDKCIMFFGSNKCKKCDEMKKILNDISRNYPNIKFSHVEVTKITVENLGNFLPILVCYKNNKPVGKVVTIDKNDIINMIQNNFENINDNKVTGRMINTQNNKAMVEISDANSYNKFLLTNKKCIVFFGSQRCPYCRNIKPLVEKMVTNYPDIAFCHIEVTNKTSDIIPKQYQQSGLPLFLCYKNNLLLDNVIGEDETGIIQMIENRLM